MILRVCCLQPPTYLSHKNILRSKCRLPIYKTETKMISLTKVQRSADSNRRFQCLKVLKSTMVVILISVLLTFPILVTAYPNGAGSCVAGRAIGTPSHIIDGGTILEAFTLQLSVNGVTVTDGDTVDIPASTASDIVVNGGTFEGISIRLDNGASIESYDDTIYKNNDRCSEPIVGITHLDSSEKTTVSATITPTITSGTIVLDIFAVMEQADPYGYSTYTLNVISDDTTATTTLAPVDAGAGDDTKKTKAPGSSSATKTKAPVATTEGAAPNATPPTATPPASAAAAASNSFNILLMNGIISTAFTLSMVSLL